MIVIIAGGRDFCDDELLKEKCDHFLSGFVGIEIVSGAASGADLLGERYAADHGYPVTRFPADWGKYGRGAGPKRNVQMAEYSDALIAFWDSKSSGTKNMIETAKKRGLAVKVVLY